MLDAFSGSPRPLAGVRVLDISSTVLGPYSTMLLAQFGADVVKVEPIEGDLLRVVGPGGVESMSGYFMTLNLGKRSIAIDIRSEFGRRAIRALVQWADVVLHNMRRSAAARLGIDSESVRELNPRAILAAAHGFAVGSSKADDPAYDDIIQATSGIAFLEGMTTEEREPRYMTNVVADKNSGILLFAGVLASLFQRERTGEVHHVEVPMHEAMVTYTLVEHLQGEAFIPPKGPAVYSRTTAPARKPYRTSDGHLSVAFYTDAHWLQFFELAGLPTLASDGRFVDLASRTANIEALYTIVAETLATRTTQYWVEELSKVGCPVAPVATVDDVIHDPSLIAQGVIQVLEHPSAGTIRTLAPPVAFDGVLAPNADIRPAPLVGEHTREVLIEAGLSAQEVDAAIARGELRDGTGEEQAS